MREQLKELNGVRQSFSATFVRFGSKPAFKGPPIKTALFYDITDATGKVLTDHVWMVVGKQIAELDLQPGDEIAYTARVTEYWRGYKGRREDDDLPPITKDYRLSFPTQFKKIVKTTEQEVLLP